MFFFHCLLLSPDYLRAPSADRRETLPHDRNLGALYNASPKVRGPLPKEIGASDSFRVPRKKSCELWSTNYRVLDVRLDPPKLIFSGDYISAPGGAGPLNFSTHYTLTKAC